MSLLGRINGDDVTEIVGRVPIHPLHSALSEYAHGEVTTQNIIDFLELGADDLPHFNYLISRIDAQSTQIDKERFIAQLWHVLSLAERKMPGHQLVSDLSARISRI